MQTITSKRLVFLKTEAAVAAHQILSMGQLNRRYLQAEIEKRIGRLIDDAEFDATMAQFGKRIIRVRGKGGFIALH
jgi:hypothetical protein